MLLDQAFIIYTMAGSITGLIIGLLIRKRWRNWVRERLEAVK
ncbi:MAG: hypothetical protein QW087_07795 [Methanomassiliicoccales archaeon]